MARWGIYLASFVFARIVSTGTLKRHTGCEMAMSKKAFISHISEEAELAKQLNTALNRDFLSFLDVFVSSDGESIQAGDEWLKSIDLAIRQSTLMLILCSPASIRRSWINFEAGAAWMQGVPIIPICHAGFTPRDLSIPLSLHQGVLLSDANGLRRVYQRIAQELNCALPNRSFDQLSKALTKVVTESDTSNDNQLLERDRALKGRLEEALKHPRFKWRSLSTLATAAGVSEEVAADYLRSDLRVRFSKGASGRVIVGLRSRVD